MLFMIIGNITDINTEFAGDIICNKLSFISKKQSNRKNITNRGQKKFAWSNLKLGS